MTTRAVTSRPEASQSPPKETLADEVRNAVAPRTILLVAGVALLCLGFVLSYVGAFHTPQPNRIPIAVVAPPQVSGEFVAGLNGITGEPLHASVVADQTTARRQLEHASTSAVLVVDAAGRQARLLIASSGGVAVASIIERVITDAEVAQQRSVTIDDDVPHQAGDVQSTNVFYLAVGAILAGYFLAVVLGMAKGVRPATFRRTLWRLAAAIPYSLVVGLGTAVITGPVLGALTGHFTAVFAISALLTFTAAVVTLSFQILFGIYGIAATILVFVILGNPSSGGPYPYRLLPPFWRTIGPALPNGAGVDALRRTIYFSATDIGPRILIILAWAAAGTALAIAAGYLRRPRGVTPRTGHNAGAIGDTVCSSD